MMKKRIIVLALLYFALLILLSDNGRSLGFDEASHAMAGAVYRDLISGTAGGKIGPATLMEFAGKYYDHYKIAWDILYYPPVQPLMIAAAYFVSGISARSAMLPNAVFAALSLVLLYSLTKKVWGKSSIMLTLLLGFSPAFFFYASSVYPDILLIFFYLMSFCLFLDYLESPTKKRAILLGASVGVGFLVKYPLAMAMPAIILSMALSRRSLVKDVPIIIGAFAFFALPWVIFQNNATDGKYLGNWLIGGSDRSATWAAGSLFSPAYMAASTLGALVTVLSPPLAIFVAIGLFHAISGLGGIDDERKYKVVSLLCWASLYILAFAAQGITHYETNKYRYFLPAVPLLLASAGSLPEKIGKNKSRLLCAITLLLMLSMFTIQFGESRSYWLSEGGAADYFLALSNTRGPVRVLVQDPVLSFALRERDPDLKRFHVFYYPPTLRETEDVLAGNSSSRALKMFGLKSCGIGYATRINYGSGVQTMPHPALQILQDWRRFGFDRLVNGRDNGSVEIYRVLNATTC